ncbi:MAG: response regulator [Paenibacillaceae bacterium]
MATFLIVDDAAIMRRSITAILEDADHTIVGECTTGKGIVSVYQRVKPDIVTLDINMPDVDGIEALELLMAAEPNAKVMMVSAIGQKHKVLEALRKGAKSYLLKPIEKGKLLELVNKLIQQPQ